MNKDTQIEKSDFRLHRLRREARQHRGTTKLHRLEENVRAANVQLTANDLGEIERAASAITVKGERCPEQLMTTTGR
jgi:hypothetical protein